METVIEYILRVSNYPWWKIVFELFCIGLIVYWAVDFLEGTRGERLFRGVLFVLAAGVLILDIVGEQFELVRLQYLYKGFLIVVLVITVAAFQPEIRRILIRIGQTRFISGSSHQLSRTIEEVITAVQQMASTRTGAIIVVQQQVGLGEFIETGVNIDSKVTAELLKTIFYPGTPLHDMAVIIKGDRIVASRVQLPLVEAGTVDGVELGSRHRAALGLTLSSDATVVVVSEETGIISLAVNGQLQRNISETELRKQLTGAITETAAMGRFWKAYIK